MNIRLLILSFVCTLLAVAQLHAGQLLYIASTQEKTVEARAINPKTGALTKKFSIDIPGNAGPMAFSPDRKFVYAAMTGLKDKKAGVATLKRAADGSLKLLKTSHITTRAPYIQVDKTGKFLLAAHYGAGDVTVYRITDSICTDELLDHQKTEQTAHCIEVDPSGKFVFVPHTKPNKVYQFQLNTETGKLTPNDPPFAEGPDQNRNYYAPRHYAHHPTLKMAYTSNEYGGGITAWKFDPAKGTLQRVQTLSTLPPEFEGRSAAADIHITPDGRFAYVSNRDVNRREKGESYEDSLAAIAIDLKTGRMKLVGYYHTTHMPRAFCIDVTGSFVYSAGQQSANLFAYRINKKTGELSKFATYETGGVPIWVMCANAGE